MTYDGPPAWHFVGKHDAFPETTHDEIARFNFISVLNRYIATQVGPGNLEAFQQRVEPQLRSANGGAEITRQQVRRAMLNEPMFQVFSALRRSAMEMRQQAGRSVVLRQRQALKEKTDALLADSDILELDPNCPIPRYLAAIDNHLMPGSYYTELEDGDVSAAANYDVGMFCTTGGALGSMTDGGGVAIAQYVVRELPDFKPKRILDIGCGLGHNAVPLAQYFPDAEVIAVDVAAPMLRYGAARACSLGIKNVRFVQATAESLLARFGVNAFDWIQTTMFWHETSTPTLRNVMADIHQMLVPGGLSLHIEQPQYSDEMPVFEQFMRDWDAYYNNEPFWSKMHDIDVYALMEQAGFDASAHLTLDVAAVTDDARFKQAETGAREDYGRAAVWHVFGATKSGQGAQAA